MEELKVGTVCYHRPSETFVRVVGNSNSNPEACTVTNPVGTDVVFTVSSSNLVPVPEWAFATQAIEAAPTSPLMAFVAEPISLRNALADFANSLNQGVRITIESLYEPEVEL